MKKIIYIIGLSLAVMACTLYLSSCSAEPMPVTSETVEPDTRATDLDALPGVPKIPYLQVTYMGMDYIKLRWLHNYREPYDYIYIYRSKSPVDLQNPPAYVIPMGTDPFAHDFIWYHTHDHLHRMEGYENWYYQVLGVSLTEEGSLNIHWTTPEVVSVEEVWRCVPINAVD